MYLSGLSLVWVSIHRVVWLDVRSVWIPLVFVGFLGGLDAEGDNICAFLKKLLRETLDFTEDTDLKKERAHRTRVADPGEPGENLI